MERGSHRDQYYINSASKLKLDFQPKSHYKPYLLKVLGNQELRVLELVSSGAAIQSQLNRQQEGFGSGEATDRPSGCWEDPECQQQLFSVRLH